MSGDVDVSRESNNGVTAEAIINTSITDNLAVRFAVRDRSDYGYMTNGYATENNGVQSTFPSMDKTIWRLSATWEPTDNATIKFKTGTLSVWVLPRHSIAFNLK
jgi:iron complex outermembrane receptor protein